MVYFLTVIRVGRKRCLVTNALDEWPSPPSSFRTTARQASLYKQVYRAVALQSKAKAEQNPAYRSFKIHYGRLLWQQSGLSFALNRRHPRGLSVCEGLDGGDPQRTAAKLPTYGSRLFKHAAHANGMTGEGEFCG